MIDYKIITLIAGMIISYCLVGFIFYKIGRRVERFTVPHLYSRITDLTFENNSLKNEIQKLKN